MPNGKRAALAPRSRTAPKVVSPRNKVTIALPFSKITAEEPMRVGDWISLAGLVVSVTGFSLALWQLIRIANASSAGQVSQQAHQQEAHSLADRPSPDVGTPIS
jgi:hypothetical protein